MVNVRELPKLAANTPARELPDGNHQVAQQLTYQCFTPLQSRGVPEPRGHISPSPPPLLQSFALFRHSIWTQLGYVSWPFLSLPRDSPACGVWQCRGPGCRQPWRAQPACGAAPETWLHGDARHCPCCSAFKSHHRLQSQHYKAAK